MIAVLFTSLFFEHWNNQGINLFDSQSCLYGNQRSGDPDENQLAIEAFASYLIN